MNSAAWAAWCCFAAVVLRFAGGVPLAMRLRARRARMGTGVWRVKRGRPTDSAGILSVIDAVRGHVRSGGALTSAFTGFDGEHRISSTPVLPNVSRLRGMLHDRAGPGETEQQVSQMAAELHMACLFSESLGCEASHCLDAVADSYRRMRLFDDQVSNAFAVPKSTVKLLTALPVGTLLLGQFLGTNPVPFLLGAAAGRVCLVFGLLAYAGGLLWMRSLMSGVADAME